MQIGCHLPVYGPAATREVLLGFARRTGSARLRLAQGQPSRRDPVRRRVALSVNPTGDFPLAPTTSFLEPLIAHGLVAGVTERIRLGTTVLVLPHRHPVLAAKMLATLDHLAPGGGVLGAWVGWMKEEIELFGVPYKRRGAWSDEAIRVMKSGWRDARVSHRGEFVRFEGLGVAPKPGGERFPSGSGATRRALRRVAELGDGWHAAFPTTAKMKVGVAELAKACGQVGRDLSSLTISAPRSAPRARAPMRSCARSATSPSSA